MKLNKNIGKILARNLGQYVPSPIRIRPGCFTHQPENIKTRLAKSIWEEKSVR